MSALDENSQQALLAGPRVTDPDLEGLIGALKDGFITSETLVKVRGHSPNCSFSSMRANTHME